MTHTNRHVRGISAVDAARPGDQSQDEDCGLPLIAYSIPGSKPMPIVPASVVRPWMDQTWERFAYRCLPMLIANQSGWLILNSDAIFVKWTGGDEPASLEITYLQSEGKPVAQSVFGQGILTWTVPYVFRTPPGYNLHVRGPSNWPKDGIAPLEGIVETDWADQTFTINWKLTRPNHVVSFSKGEPICMVVPRQRGELESFRPQTLEIQSDPNVLQGFTTFQSGRLAFNSARADAAQRGEDVRFDWQKHYFRGSTPTGKRAPEHQTKIDLRPFEDAQGSDR